MWLIWPRTAGGGVETKEDKLWMRTLTTTQELADFCEHAQTCDYVTVDTEFLRERSYYSKLCMIQLALSGKSLENAVLVDP